MTRPWAHMDSERARRMFCLQGQSGVGLKWLVKVDLSGLCVPSEQTKQQQKDIRGAAPHPKAMQGHQYTMQHEPTSIISHSPALTTTADK